jgi:hypothetical protein
MTEKFFLEKFIGMADDMVVQEIIKNTQESIAIIKHECNFDIAEAKQVLIEIVNQIEHETSPENS